jgi:UDP-N-acetylglucosamine--N-acetylmuramyl-(pentapeptide) pyrophosphoryl-undecaprenol N-acetylglucosamine transferase
LGFAERAQVKPFIIDMPGALGAADIVVGRAGAGAVGEICAVGRPSLLVPYPFAGDHQKVNAESLRRAAASIWVPSAEATPERIRAELRALTSDPAKLVSMAENARRIGRPNAARTIAEDLLSLAGLSPSQLSTINYQLSTPSDNGFVKLTEVA